MTAWSPILTAGLIPFSRLNSKKLSYRIIQSKTLYRGHVIRLVKDRFILDVAKEKIVTRELVVHPGAVVVIPFADKSHILLLKQFRYAAKGDLWEIPAGTLEKNEDPLACAKRELEEETGFKAKRWRFLTRFYPAPGISNEIMTLFRADDLTEGQKNLDPDEWIEHKKVSFSQALHWIKNGRIRDAKTLAGVLWCQTFR